jgi:hypothetical protein
MNPTCSLSIASTRCRIRQCARATKRAHAASGAEANSTAMLRASSSSSSPSSSSPFLFSASRVERGEAWEEASCRRSTRHLRDIFFDTLILPGNL